MDSNVEQTRIELGTQNRRDLSAKYRLNEEPAKLAHASEVTREACHQAAPILSETSDPAGFAHVLEENVTAKLRGDPSLRDESSEQEDSYGERAAKAYIERGAMKARDEIGLWLKGNGLDTAETRRIIGLLPHANSLAQIAELAESLLQIPELRDRAQELFQQARDAKIQEFEEFYNREKQKGNS